jgi:hypothetical protein
MYIIPQPECSVHLTGYMHMQVRTLVLEMLSGPREEKEAHLTGTTGRGAVGTLVLDEQAGAREREVRGTAWCVFQDRVRLINLKGV